jgi:PDZ domain
MAAKWLPLASVLVTAVALLAGCSSAKKPTAATPAQSGAHADARSQRQAILEVLDRYASAYTDHSTTALAALFSDGVERTSNTTGSCMTTRGHSAVINVYRGQFAHGPGRYELDGLVASSVDFAPGITEDGALEASATGRYQITPHGSCGSIAFVLNREPDGPWRISRIGANCPVRMTSPPQLAESQSDTGPSSESTSGPGFLGVEVDNMSAQTSAGGLVLGSQESSEKEYGCKIPPEGALIVRTEPHGPASEAGLDGATAKLGGYPVGGDLIVGLDGAPIPDTDVLLADLAQHKAGEVVQVEVVHCNGSRSTATVTLAATTHTREEAAEAEAAREREATQRARREEQKLQAESKQDEAKEEHERAEDHRETEEGAR